MTAEARPVVAPDENPFCVEGTEVSADLLADAFVKTQQVCDADGMRLAGPREFSLKVADLATELEAWRALRLLQRDRLLIKAVGVQRNPDLRPGTWRLEPAFGDPAFGVAAVAG